MLDFLSDGDIQASFLEGLSTTLYIAACASLLALLIGLVMAFARSSQRPWVQKTAIAYVEIFRNTPLLIQLYFYYRGLQSLGLMLPPELCGILALAFYTGAYLTEVFRAGLLAIPKEQTEAALALGLPSCVIYRQILLPQAIRIVLPAIGNQLISLVKNSSLVAFITVNDLFLVIYKGAVDHFQPVEYFLEGAALYLSISLSIAGVIQLLEHTVFPNPSQRKNTTPPHTPLPPAPPTNPGGAIYG